MTTLYLIRHGQTANNLIGTFNGSESDQPLNETGLEMAAALTKAFASIKLDAIYASPILRAMKYVLEKRHFHPAFKIKKGRNDDAT